MRALLLLALAAALLAPLLLWRDDIQRIFAERGQVIARIQSAGAWGPAVLIALSIAQTVVAPIPGQMVNFAAGYIYGLAGGFAYSWLGLILGTASAMGLARWAGRPLVARLIGRELLGRLDRLAQQRSLGFFFLFFLIPGLPDDLLCFAIGLTRLPLRILLPMAALARIPGLLAAVWLGARAESLPWQVWAASGVLGLAAAFLIWRYGERVQEALMRLTDPARRAARRDCDDL
ncbi:MAG: TVP38/TMEM64 family inner membrane protein YdjZ [Chloroflexi bacterium ADurb.Bin325]|nr:MAG: TVP38/TMEM64 family inner membrane protein YdjZ [Chloroflexi bacterium ADurb.Bin325]